MRVPPGALAVVPLTRIGAEMALILPRNYSHGRKAMAGVMPACAQAGEVCKRGFGRRRLAVRQRQSGSSHGGRGDAAQLSVLALAIALADLVLRLVEWTAGRRTGGPQAAPTTQR